MMTTNKYVSLGGLHMENYCAFSKNHACLKWIDYQLTRHELEEADTLCHGNWIEIQSLYKRIDTLEALLKGKRSIT